MVSTIIEAPQNALAVLCEDDRAIMSCTSNGSYGIVWSYDGNTVITSPCRETNSEFYTSIFLGRSSTDKECDIIALLDEARQNTNVQTVSGVYGCTDQFNNGVTETSMVIVLGMFRH